MTLLSLSGEKPIPGPARVRSSKAQVNEDPIFNADVCKIVTDCGGHRCSDFGREQLYLGFLVSDRGARLLPALAMRPPTPFRAEWIDWWAPYRPKPFSSLALYEKYLLSWNRSRFESHSKLFGRPPSGQVPFPFWRNFIKFTSQ